MKYCHYFDSKKFSPPPSSFSSFQELCESLDPSDAPSNVLTTVTAGGKVIFSFRKTDDGLFCGSFRLKTAVSGISFPPSRCEVIEFEETPQSVMLYYLEMLLS